MDILQAHPLSLSLSVKNMWLKSQVYTRSAVFYKRPKSPILRSFAPGYMLSALVSIEITSIEYAIN